jgi:hypothetical protein
VGSSRLHYRESGFWVDEDICDNALSRVENQGPIHELLKISEYLRELMLTCTSNNGVLTNPESHPHILHRQLILHFTCYLRIHFSLSLFLCGIVHNRRSPFLDRCKSSNNYYTLLTIRVYSIVGIASLF